MEENRTTDFSRLYQQIQDNKINHDNGYYNCIPFHGFSRTEKYLEGVTQSTYTLITASSGVGKSKLARSLFIHNPYNYYKENPNIGIDLDIIYFSLEESRDKVILGEVSKYLLEKYGYRVSMKDLLSRGRYNTIDAEIIAAIPEAEERVTSFLDTIQVIDYIRNPTGIYKHVRDHMLKIGTYYDKYGNPLTPLEVEEVRTGTGESYKKVAYYRTYNPKHYVIVVTDHIGLLDNETVDGVKLTQWQTMQRFSAYYCLKMRDSFGCTVVNVQQQASDKERIDTNFKGDTIESKLEPSLDGLANNKETQRDANIVLGLFGPNRYNIENHLGYDIRIIKDRYRCLSILKDRDGIANKKIPLFFDGAVDFFKEMPRTNNVEGMANMLARVQELEELDNR